MPDNSFSLPMSLDPSILYWWSSKARDDKGNTSQYSDPLMGFRTKDPILLSTIIDSFNYGWNAISINDNSIYAIVQNCLKDPNYTFTGVNSEGYEVTVVDVGRNAEIRGFANVINAPVYYLNDIDGDDLKVISLITPWYDASWGNNIALDMSYKYKFNTVYGVGLDKNDNFINIYDKPILTDDDRFEVISFIDQTAPTCGTANKKCYFFTYNTLTNENGVAIESDEWLSYLMDIKNKYKRSIDTLTIFAHGKPGTIFMSKSFYLTSDSLSQNAMEKLKWDASKNDGILSKNSTILLFSCNVGKDQIGATFVKNLANWTGATVYANSISTGNIIQDGDIVSQDWELDVIGIPDNYTLKDKFDVPVKSSIETTLMLPNGIMLKIEKGDLTHDGVISVKNVYDQLAELGIQHGDTTILNAYEISLENSSITEGNGINITVPASYNNDMSSIGVKFWDKDSNQWSTSGISNVLVNTTYVSFTTTHTTIFAIIFNKAPIADAKGSYSGSTGVPISFDAGQSYDPDGFIVSYEWDWDNNGTYDQITTTPSITHTWTAVYHGIVGLKVTDNDGMTTVTTASVNVAKSGTTICSRLGINKRIPLDVDVFKFNGEKGEKITIKLQANPSGTFSGQNAALTLTGPRMFKRDAAIGLPNEIVGTLPMNGVYQISVGNVMVARNRLIGDYCISLESSGEAQNTIQSTASVEKCAFPAF